VNLKSSINSALDWANPFLGLLRRIPWQVWLGAACLGFGALWLHEHDVWVRQKALAAQAQQQSAARVSSLKKQVAANVQAANVADAQAVAKLESRRQKLERQDRALAARLASLSKAEQAEAEQVAALPTPEVVTRVTAQLGLRSQDLMPAGAQSATTAAADSPSGPAAAAPPVAGHPQGAAAAGAEPYVLPLSASGARKVETALVELNACRSESQVEGERVSNCQERAATDAATIREQADSIGKLNQALTAKGQILGEQEAEYKTELRAVRGTFWSRLAHTTKHVAIGVALGVAVGMAVR